MVLRYSDTERSIVAIYVVCVHVFITRCMAIHRTECVAVHVVCLQHEVRLDTEYGDRSRDVCYGTE